MKAYPKKTRFVVWGYGVTGQALVDVLHARDYPVKVVEDKPVGNFDGLSEKIETLTKEGVEFHFGDIHNHDFIDYLRHEADVFSPSPGIAVSPEILDACEEAKIQVAGEIEIAFRLVPGKIIAVTGTDGKTTTATLIHHMLASAGLTAHLAGNVGTPFISLAGRTRHDHWLVIEVSSYQLETVRRFRPRIAVLLNIAEDHLSRHGDIRTYIRVKGGVFERQRDNDAAVLNFDDPACLQAHAMSRSHIYGFSLAGRLKGGAWRDGTILYADTEKGPRKIIDTSEMKLIGDHNHLNALAAILACKLAECPLAKMGPALGSFESLPHRIEQIAEIEGVRWINDSKATNVHSTISALKVFKQPIILILGGYDKGLNIADLIPQIQRNTRHVILMGETRNRFRRELREAGYANVTVRKTLAEACAAAMSMAQQGEIVLLSPASSSFDQFKSYVERGEAFRRWVERKIAEKEK
jgi:UDP-N-acetylmuramoylalanine--D-glutamate ligase